MAQRDETTRDVAEDPDVRSVVLEDDEGNEVVIEQQNVGIDNEVGQGEYPDAGTPPKDPGDAAAERAELDRQTERDRQ